MLRPVDLYIIYGCLALDTEPNFDRYVPPRISLSNGLREQASKHA